MNNRNVKILSPFVLCCQKVIPLAFDESMSYYECLCGLYNYIMNSLVPAINENADAVTELQNKVNELKNYIDNYFDNLDVQEEINNKLDEMAESGQLTEIVTDYLKIKGILAYNTVNDMKLSDNLVDGSFAKTYGKTSLLDGLGRFYKVREVLNTDVVDEINIIALNDPNLIAELIPEKYLNDIGDINNLNTDNKTNLVSAINEINNKTTGQLLKGKNIILIGDSLGVSNGWGNYFITYTGCNGENCCSGSAGFLSKGITPPFNNMDFNEILNYIISNKTSIERNSIDYIVVGGGINDALNNYAVADIKTAVQTFITTVKTNFQNAKLIIFPINTFRWVQDIELNRYLAIIDTAKDNGIQTTEEFLYWLATNSSYNSGDDVHLTDSGYQKLAHYIEEFINGGNIDTTEVIDFTINSAWEKNLFFNVYRKGNRCYARGVLHKKNNVAVAYNDVLLNFTEGARITGSSNFNLVVPAFYYKGGYNTGAIGSINIENGQLKVMYPVPENFINCFIYVNISWLIGISGE